MLIVKTNKTYIPELKLTLLFLAFVLWAVTIVHAVLAARLGHFTHD